MNECVSEWVSACKAHVFSTRPSHFSFINGEVDKWLGYFCYGGHFQIILHHSILHFEYFSYIFLSSLNIDHSFIFKSQLDFLWSVKKALFYWILLGEIGGGNKELCIFLVRFLSNKLVFFYIHKCYIIKNHPSYLYLFIPSFKKI